jgi:hypothetical protein
MLQGEAQPQKDAAMLQNFAPLRTPGGRDAAKGRVTPKARAPSVMLRTAVLLQDPEVAAELGVAA